MKLGPLNKTSVVIQLADKSIAYPKGVAEDVLVQVNDLVFPIDFYVLDMENGDQTTPILLGRPFLKTSKTKIDVHSGILTRGVHGSGRVGFVPNPDSTRPSRVGKISTRNRPVSSSKSIGSGHIGYRV